MARRAAVLIDLKVSDPTAELYSVSTAADAASASLADMEASSKATNAAVSDLRLALKHTDADTAAWLVGAKHGADAAAAAIAQITPPPPIKIDESAFFGLKNAADVAAKALGRMEDRAQAADKAMDRLGDRTGELGGKIASFGGMLSLPGLDRGAQAVTGLGDTIELLSSPLGAAIGATTAWAVAFGGVIVGAAALVAASDDLIERLETVGRTDVITDEQQAQLKAGRDAMTAIVDAWAEIGLTLATNVGGSVTAVAEVVVGVSLEIGKAVKWASERIDFLRTALNFLTGGAIGQAEMVADAFGIDLGGALAELTERLRAQGEAYSTANAAARDLSQTETGRAVAIQSTTNALEDQARLYQSTAGTLTGILDSARSDLMSAQDRQLADLAAQLGRVLELAPDAAAVGLQGLVDDAALAVTDRMQRILDEMAAAQAAALDAFAALPAASATALQAIRAARQATTQAVLGDAQGVVGVLGGGIGSALGGLGPGGALLGAVVELGPDTVANLDAQLEVIGDNLLALPETLAGLLAKIIGFGADNTGQGIGRFIGAVLGGTIGFFVGGGPVGAAAGAALGSAALGQALGGRDARTASDRATRTAPRSSITINGIVTSDVLRTLDREARIKSGGRGLRLDLARGA